MKLHNRILSTLLAVLLMLGSLTVFTVGTYAAEDTEEEVILDDADIENVYVKTVYNTPEEKVYGTEEKPSTMKKMLERNGYQLYVDSVSGEIAVVDTKSGQILFSNPYDVASSIGSASTKKQILSQMVVQYIDNGTTKYLYSFEEAAMRNQIKVLNIKNGVRVEYTIGREESRKLVPRWISAVNYTKFIDTPMKAAVENGEIDEFYYKKFDTYFTLQALSEKKSKKAREQLLMTYPICEKMDIRTFASDASTVELNWCETYIKTYCEDYTFEQMDADHEETGYEATDEKFPVFKMALEYTLDENGLTARLPCNGLRYDMSTYTLESLTPLPYMGAGNSSNPGYNFYPDGSGSLFDFEQLNTKSTTTVRGKIYGIDYAYHTITGTYQKAIRYPVFGTVAAETLYTFTYSYPEVKTGANGKQEETGKLLSSGPVTVSNSVLAKDEIEEYIAGKNGTLTSTITEETYDRGFVAVIEAGESLADVATYHAGSLSDYNTMMTYFNPKPKDSYDIADAISVTTSSTWTVVSERKYTGSIKIRYMMLTDPDIGKATQEENEGYAYYDATWLGMAEAYRDYLVSNGTLTKMEETEDNIPLYLEVFGALETQQTIATIPVDVMTPLTTFDNIYTIYERLSKNGVGNINFKLTGFANGGMYATVPAALKWEKAVGGKEGFKKLVEQIQKANAETENHVGIYPDFDFAYIQVNELFDSTNLKDDAVKTIDNRYTSKRQYSATMQSYISFYQLAISPSRYSKFYTKLLKNYEQYGLNTMSVASLGTALNSDFDEDEPYNREDGKEFTVQAFQDLKAAGYSLMTEGANAYTWGYVDHILNVDLDSSRYVKSSASVPFIGAVLHGYVQFAGTPFNEEGDTDYAILRAIENGAGLYFILSYQNTNELKEDTYLSQYYSVRYDIWEQDVIAYYEELNSVLKDLQTKVIIDHQFLNGVSERVLDLDELQVELEKQLKAAAEAEKLKQQEIETGKVLEAADAWKLAENASADIQDIIDKMAETNESIMEDKSMLEYYIKNLPDIVNMAVNMMLDYPDSVEEKSAIDQMNSQIGSIRTLAVNILKSYALLDTYYAEIGSTLKNVQAAKKVIENADTLSEEVRKKMAAEIANYYTEAAKLLTPAEKELNRIETEQGFTADDIIALAVGSMDKVTVGEITDLEERFKEACKDYVFDEEILKEMSKQKDDETESGETGDGETADNKYVVDNNQVVLVTYGDRADKSEGFKKTPCKSFILNYNTFAVRVTYENKTYTIPSGGYVVIDETVEGEDSLS